MIEINARLNRINSFYNASIDFLIDPFLLTADRQLQLSQPCLVNLVKSEGDSERRLTSLPNERKIIPRLFLLCHYKIKI